jgi:hypothetical protein
LIALTVKPFGDGSRWMARRGPVAENEPSRASATGGFHAAGRGTTFAYIATIMRRLLLLIAIAALLAGCASPTDASDVDSSSSDLGTEPSIPALPAPGGTGDLAPWGGSDSSKWRAEAIMANAVGLEMNAAWSRSDVKDVVVAVPTKIWSSGFYEFGDGQANSRVEFEYWKGTARPPVIATLIQFKSSPTKVVFRFDRALPYSGTAFEIRYNATTAPLTATRDAQGDAVVEWTLPSDLSWNDRLSEQSAVVHPVGWGDWFPIFFRMPVKKITDLKASATSFSDGKSIIDREHMTSVGAADGLTALQRLQGHSFPAGYNGVTGIVPPFNPRSIHATYPFYGTTITTGVGQGWTWVADERPAGFKVMYTCFEHRRQDLEASAPNGGVCSGGGWHQINDAAETVLNDLETGPVLVASGKNNPWLPSQYPSGAPSYGLTDVATFRWLRPGEAFITPKGGWTSDGNGKWFEMSNYHWYLFQQTKDVCTEEIVNAPGQVPQNFDL